MDTGHTHPALLRRARPRVLITQEQNFNFSEAERFGDIEFLTAADVHNVKGSMHNETLIRDIRRVLRGYDQDIDWILIAGSPYVSAIVFMVLGSLGFKRVRILRWSNQERVYLPVYLQLPV